MELCLTGTEDERDGPRRTDHQNQCACKVKVDVLVMYKQACVME